MLTHRNLVLRACHVLLFGVLVAPAHAADRPAPDRHRAHQHGVARMEITLEGGELRIAIESPSENILGFEHAPKTEGQRKTVSRAEQQLRQSEQVFAMPAAAGCTPQPARVEMKLPPPGSRETHSEIEAEWRWSCALPAALARIDVGLFRAFPRLKELRVQVVTPQGQKAAVVKPNAARVTLAP